MYSYFKDPLSSFFLLLTHGARLVTRKHAATGAYISRAQRDDDNDSKANTCRMRDVSQASDETTPQTQCIPLIMNNATSPCCSG